MKKLCLILMVMVLKMAYCVDLFSNQIKLNGHLLHYYKAGDRGQPIILLTGYATTSNFWNRQFISCLATNHQVYLFDYQGINTPDKADLSKMSIQSMAKDVNAMVSKLNIHRPLLLGWSMGGAVTLEASFMAPDLYEQIYLLSPVVPTEGKSRLSLPMPEHPVFKSDNDVISYVFNNNLYNYNPDDVTELRKEFIQNGLEQIFPSKQVRDAQGRAIATWISSKMVREQFNNATTPAVFYIPDHDRILDSNVALPIAKEYRNASIIQVKNSGHAVAWQIPEQLCKSIDIQ